MEELRWRDQISDGFERRDQIDGAVGRGLDMGFIGDSSLRPSAWAWREWWEWVTREIFWGGWKFFEEREGEDRLRLAWGRVPVISSLSLSLSLSTRLSPEMVWSENRNVKQFSGQSHNIYGQMKCFSRKFYFPCATKHTVRCKIISWNGFTPKQMQPKWGPNKWEFNILNRK